MESDWTVACGADDPWIVLPWATEDGLIRYIDLNGAPDKVDEIPEAAQHPSLAAALLRWNQPDAPLFTAKCDVWWYAADSFDAGDLVGFAHAQGSYIDLIPREPAVFSSFAACERMLQAGAESSRDLAVPEGRCEWTLRPARVSTADNGYRDGFAITLYVWGYGSSPQAAASSWSTALLALIQPVLLLKNLSV